ncbi:MAG TPA: CsbD family protein [Stellaceae bacterium]|nr:CsbD family protein [Stellaceae bacterium]
MNSNELEGAVRDAKGKLKDGYGGLTGDVGTQLDGKLDQAAGKLQSRFGDTTDQVSEAAWQAAHQASEFADRAGDTLLGAAETATTTLRDQGQQLRDTVADASAQAGRMADRTFRQNPILSLIGVGAVGYLLSYLIHAPSAPLAPRSRRSSSQR